MNSIWTRLNVGDLICTGTPGGVGAARQPPVWLSPGDTVEVSVEHVGSITNKLIPDSNWLATDAWAELAKA
jgi:2-keto-4-pentenoate hydratase/2-oxohepta-3-ene-1,7-dioic acid hydratase in catechol pathway